MKIMKSKGTITESWGTHFLQIVSYWLGNIRYILIYYLPIPFICETLSNGFLK